jgi:hypothetical protein
MIKWAFIRSRRAYQASFASVRLFLIFSGDAAPVSCARSRYFAANKVLAAARLRRRIGEYGVSKRHPGISNNYYYTIIILAQQINHHVLSRPKKRYHIQKGLWTAPRSTKKLPECSFAADQASQITEIEYLTPELLPDIPELKFTMVDIRCRDNTGRQFHVFFF